MIGKSLTTRVILLIIAIVLLIVFWGYGVSHEILIGLIFLVVLRLLFLLAKLYSKSNSNSDNK